MNTSILEQSYPGYRSFVDNILSKIFDGWNIYPVPEDQIDGSYSDVVTSCIKSVYKVADNTPLDASRIELYDVTVRDTVNIARARVGIRELIKRLHFPYTHAFILFHYENPEGRSWRFSYLYKEGTQANMTNAKRYTYVFGPNCPCRTAVQRLTKLAGLKQIHDKDIKDAFSVEALSEEFFAEYKEHYADFVQYVTGKRIVEVSAKKFETIDVCAPNEEFYNAFGRDDKRVRDYVKKMMGRLVFLCFIQRKGWLNANPYYLQELFANSTQKKDFLDAVLEPMFFGLLNTKPEERDGYFQQNNWDMSLIPGAKDIPYLNGGLFEADENDAPPSKFPMELFSNEQSAKAKDEPKKYTYSAKKEKSEIYDYHRFRGLLDFFAAYNFTIDENDPNDAEVGVDPEMLGKIFENLLEDNKDKGAFYTPKEIVQYMCRESLIAYLQTDIESEDTKAELRDFVTTHEASCLSADKDIVAEKLRTVKICDPAIGSGAFPMGLLNELVACREALFPNQDKAQLKKEIIQNNIYGVDIEKGAIDIARLRFWLSIVVDLENAEPLPNFDYKFMQGNSLLEQYSINDKVTIDLSNMIGDNKKMRAIVEQNSPLFKGQELKIDLWKELKEYFYLSDHNAKQTKFKRIEECIRDFIRVEIGRTFKKSSQILERNTALDAFQKLDIFNQDFFLWHTWFADVFEQGGFDIVIGNPPYIQLQADKGKLGKLYDKKGFKSFFKTGDIYCLFIEQAYNVAKENGIVSYINPNTWLQSISFAPIRRFITTNFSWISALITDKVFDNATVDTHCLLFRKSLNRTACSVFKMNKTGYLSFVHDVPCSQITDKEEAINIEADQNVIKVINKILQKSTALSKYCDVYSGVNPFEKGKGKPAQTAEMVKNHVYVKEGEKPADNWTPLLRGSLMHRYTNYWDNNYWILYGDNLAAPRDPKIFEANKKIIVRQTGDSIIATIIGKNIICRKNLHICVPKDVNIPLSFILGIMNSCAMDFVYQFMNPEKGEALAEVKKAHVEELPIPQASDEDINLLSSYVDQILAAKKSNPSADTSDLEREIDRLVYELYGLTNGEVKIIDPEAIASGADDELYKA